MINTKWHEIYDIREGTYSSDFRIHNPLDNSRGDTYSDMQQSFTNWHSMNPYLTYSTR